MIEEISSQAERLVAALEASDYDSAAAALRAETGLRRRLFPEIVSDTDLLLLRASTRLGCGAKPAGRGGAIWGIGPADAIDRLRVEWAKLLGRGRGYLFQHKFVQSGLQVRCSSSLKGK